MRDKRECGVIGSHTRPTTNVRVREKRAYARALRSLKERKEKKTSGISILHRKKEEGLLSPSVIPSLRRVKCGRQLGQERERKRGSPSVRLSTRPLGSCPYWRLSLFSSPKTRKQHEITSEKVLAATSFSSSLSWQWHNVP